MCEQRIHTTAYGQNLHMFHPYCQQISLFSMLMGIRLDTMLLTIQIVIHVQNYKVKNTLPRQNDFVRQKR
jgi:hypothetical protein